MKPYCSDEVLRWLKENAYVYGSYNPAEQAYLLKDMPRQGFTPQRLHIPLSAFGQARLLKQLKAKE